MAAQQQFAAFLGQKEDTTGQFIVLSDTASASGGFMTNYYIHRAIRAGHRTCIVSLLHTLEHYSSICNKLGASLFKAISENSLKFIDCLLGAISSESTTKINQIFQSPYNSKDLRSAIFGAIDSLQGAVASDEKCDLPTTCVIMDNVNILLSLGWSVGEVVKLVTAIYSHVTEITNSKGYIVIASHDIREDDDELGGADNSLYLHLLHHSTLSLKISGLSTGYSKDVHGEVTRYSHDPMGISPLQYKTQSHSTQYRILDKGMRLFAKGTSEAVL